MQTNPHIDSQINCNMILIFRANHCRSNQAKLRCFSAITPQSTTTANYKSRPHTVTKALTLRLVAEKTKQKSRQKKRKQRGKKKNLLLMPAVASVAEAVPRTQLRRCYLSSSKLQFPDIFLHFLSIETDPITRVSAHNIAT